MKRDNAEVLRRFIAAAPMTLPEKDKALLALWELLGQIDFLFTEVQRLMGEEVMPQA